MMDATPGVSEGGRKRRGWGLALWIALPLLVLLLGFRLLWPYAANYAAQEHFRKLGGSLSWRPRGPEWLQKLLGPRWSRMLCDIPDMNLERSQVRDADLRRLALLPGLQTINLSRTRITDAGVAALLAVPDLESVALNSTGITDEGLKMLSAHRGIRILNVSYCRVTDAGVAHLSTMLQLSDLTLNRTRISSGVFKELQPLTALVGLSVEGCRISDGGMADVPKLLSLRGLSLKGTCVSDRGLALWDPPPPSLQSLDLLATRVTDAGITSLKDVPRLQYVEVDQSTISPKAAEELTKNHVAHTVRVYFKLETVPKRFECED